MLDYRKVFWAPLYHFSDVCVAYIWYMWSVGLHVCGHVCLCRCTGTCVCNDEKDLHRFLTSSLITFHLVNWGMVSPTLELAICLVQMASLPWGSPDSDSWVLGVQVGTPSISLLCGFWEFKLKFSYFLDKHPIHWAIFQVLYHFMSNFLFYYF